MYGQELAFTGGAGLLASGVIWGGAALAVIGIALVVLAAIQLARKPGKVKP